MQIDVEIPKDVNNSRMKGKPKPDKQQILASVRSPSWELLVVPIIRFF
jgi:hypothetical protein